MDFDYLKLVLNDFTLKQLFIINWLNNNLDNNMQDRNEQILNILREHSTEQLKEWTTVKIGQALMAINELGFLNRNEEKELDVNLRSYLTVKKRVNVIIEPYVKKCCGKHLHMTIGRNITVFAINKSYAAAIMNGVCQTCDRKYLHNYFIAGKQKFVTTESIFNSRLIYFGGEYAYESSLIKSLSNSILYLHCGFENFCKYYNETKNQTLDKIIHDQSSLSPTRLQDFWFLYNFVTFSFFYTKTTTIQIVFSW